MAPASVVISAEPLPSRAVMSTGVPGSFAERGTRSQFLPPSVVCRRMAGLPTIHPSSPLKEMELKRKLKPSSAAASTDRGSQVLPPSKVSNRVCRVPNKKPWFGSEPVKPTSSRTTPLSTGSSTCSHSADSRRLLASAGREGCCTATAAESANPALKTPRREADCAASEVASQRIDAMGRAARAMREVGRPSRQGAAVGGKNWREIQQSRSVFEHHFPL